MGGWLGFDHGLITQEGCSQSLEGLMSQPGLLEGTEAQLLGVELYVCVCGLGWGERVYVC